MYFIQNIYLDLDHIPVTESNPTNEAEIVKSNSPNSGISFPRLNPKI